MCVFLAMSDETSLVRCKWRKINAVDGKTFQIEEHCSHVPLINSAKFIMSFSNVTVGLSYSVWRPISNFYIFFGVLSVLFPFIYSEENEKCGQKHFKCSFLLW